MSKSYRTKALERDIASLTGVLESLDVRNPVNWLPIIRLIAPFIARVAIRAVLRKMGRSASPETVEEGVTLVRRILNHVGADVPGDKAK